MMLDYILILLGGFLGSYHCIGMCGFIPSLIESKNFWISNILYNIGRIFSYAFLGFLAGYFGMFFHKIEFQFIQQVLSVIIGIFIIIFGLQIAGGLKEKGVFFLDIIFITISDILKSFRKNPFLLGVFNGFLPCPLVYAFLMRALFEQNPVKGMIVMILFGIGTVPAMLFASKLFKILSSQKRKKLTLFSGIIVIILGILTILRGFGLHHH